LNPRLEALIEEVRKLEKEMVGDARMDAEKYQGQLEGTRNACQAIDPALAGSY
jgi:hypothetical protein